MTARPSLYGIQPDQHPAFIEDWKAGVTVRMLGRKYQVDRETVRATASRLNLPSRKRGAHLVGGTRERPTCYVCGAPTNGLCGCRGRAA